MPYKDPEKRKQKLKEWKAKNPEYAFNYRRTNKWKKWHKKYVNGPVATAYRKKYNQQKSLSYREERIRQRNTTLDAMGGKCSSCGFSDFRALQIDHVNGDGKNERKNPTGRSYYEKVLQSFLKKEGKYQLLCANCNWIKRHENKEYCGKKA